MIHLSLFSEEHPPVVDDSPVSDTVMTKKTHTHPSPHRFIHAQLDMSHFIVSASCSYHSSNQPPLDSLLSLSLSLSLSLAMYVIRPLQSLPTDTHPFMPFFYYYLLVLIIKLLPRYKRESLSLCLLCKRTIIHAWLAGVFCFIFQCKGGSIMYACIVLHILILVYRYIVVKRRMENKNMEMGSVLLAPDN